MKSETKLFIGIILGTVAIIAGGILLLSRSAVPVKVDSSLLIRADSNKIASGSGTVTLVEFSDFQCPACGAYYAPVKQLVNEFKDSMTFVYRNFPLTTLHKNAQLAAAAAEAAGLQGSYWGMHDKLFETQTDWSNSDTAKDIFITYAEGLKLDKNQFIKDLESDAVRAKIQKDVDDGNALAINSTPTFFLNSEKIDNPAGFADFEALVKAAINNAPKPTISKTEAFHTHANFRVYVNGAPVDFSIAKYQGANGKDLDENIHLHDNKGDLIHIHKQGITLGEFITSLKFELPKTAKLYVNGKEQKEFLKYIPQDLDKLLITDATDNTVIQKQLSSVPDDACIYSLKCPSRGTPPTENCVGGLGTGCKE
jgi:protein-disulfide isomerase